MSHITGSTPSEISIGFGEKLESSETKGLPKGPSPPKNFTLLDADNHKILCDTLCLAVVCGKHKRIAVQRQPNLSYFLPNQSFHENFFFNLAIRNLLKKIFPNIIPAIILQSSPRLIDIWRCEQPRTNKFVSRFIFSIIFFDCHGCCFDFDGICWIDVNKAANWLCADTHRTTSFNLWGNECRTVLRTLCKNPNTMRLYSNAPFFREIGFKERLYFLTEKTNEAILLYQLGYEEREIRMILNEFIVHCFPSETMSFAAFCKFYCKLLPRMTDREYFTPLKICMMFNAFITSTEKSVLTFRELIIGLSLVDENSICIVLNQTNKFANWLHEKRIPYIFRYYDLDRDGFLNVAEFNLLLNEYAKELDEQNQLPKMLSSESDRKSLVKTYIEKFGALMPVSGQLGLAIEQARSALRDLMQRLCAIDEDIPDILKVVFHMNFDINYASGKFNFLPITARSKSVAFCLREEYLPFCSPCTNRKFGLTEHIIYLTVDGHIYNIVRIEPVSTKVTISVDIPETSIFLLANEIIIKLFRLGEHLFSDSANEEDDPEEDTKLIKTWFFTTESEMFESIREITHAASRIFENERRVIDIKSPCYVFGDLHGNLKDLLSYSRQFWPYSPFFNCGQYLFLGNYVERGEWAIEVIVFLFCLKILAPHSFILLRGTHEVREVQKCFTFHHECKQRLTNELWEMINDCFDRMPIAAIIDERIFCSHAGIPTSSLDWLRSIQCPLHDPRQQSEQAWEILWNDPIDETEWNRLPANCRRYSRFAGFTHDNKRNNTYDYNEQAVSNFCAHNSFDFIIRGNDAFADGFRFFIHGLVITLFSSSNHCEMNNSAAVLFVKQNRIRVTRIERPQ